MTPRIGFFAGLLLLSAPVYGQSVLGDLPPDPRRPSTPEALAGSDYTLESSTTSFAQLLSLHVNLSERQSVGINTEFLKLASFYFRMGGYEEQPDWKFKAVPLTLTYERLLSAPDRPVVPVVGVGLSYYLTQLRTRLPESVTGPQQPYTPIDSYTERCMGMGWGAQATAGIRARVSGNTFVQLQARYRLINGLGLAATDQADARFGVFDFAIGFGFSL